MSASQCPIVTRQPDGCYNVEIYDGLSAHLGLGRPTLLRVRKTATKTKISRSVSLTSLSSGRSRNDHNHHHHLPRSVATAWLLPEQHPSQRLADKQHKQVEGL